MVIRSKQVTQDDDADKSVTLVAPTKAGQYQLRYYDARNQAILATRPIRVDGPDISLSAPDTTPAGANESRSLSDVEVNSDDDEPVPTEDEGGEDQIITSNSQTLDLECSGESIKLIGNSNRITIRGKSAQLIVDGNSNIIHFEGACEELIITGNSNTAQMELIGSIKAKGNSNQITWVAASNGQRPSIVSDGNDNLIQKEE